MRETVKITVVQGEEAVVVAHREAEDEDEVMTEETMMMVVVVARHPQVVPVVGAVQVLVHRESHPLRQAMLVVSQPCYCCWKVTEPP